MARVRAPQLLGRGGWIGASADLGLASLAGKVVVLHFWTSSCINCVRLLRELAPIEERFSDEVVVVGIHSPKFPREHEHEAVERAVERLRVPHPVLDDPDLGSWQQYAIKGWPTLVLIDPEGYVVGGVSGEGSGPMLTSSIEAVIADHDGRGTLVRGPVTGAWGRATYSPGWQTLSFPAKVAVDGTGRRLAIADTGNDRVIVTDRQGRMEQVHPLLTRPQGVRFDGDRLVVCDTGADRVVAIDRSTGEQTVLVRGLASPSDVAVLADGWLLVTEAGRHRLWWVPPGGGEAVVAAGTGQEGLVDTDPSSEAVLAQPSGVAALAGGGAVFVDAESSSLRVLQADGSVVTLVGQGLFDWGASDGGPDAAALQHPLGVAVGRPPAGQPAAPPPIYVADTFNSMVREWTGTSWSAASGTVRTLPATGLEEPGGVDVLPDGRLLVADTNHHRVVIVDPAAADPEALIIDEGWLGTASGDDIGVVAGAPLRVPYSFDPGQLFLDPSAGPPLRIEVSAEPGTLLAPGPRRWALASAEGVVELVAGAPGEGILVVEIEVSVCDDEQASVLRARSRHDVTVAGEHEPAPGDQPAPVGARS